MFPFCNGGIALQTGSKTYTHVTVYHPHSLCGLLAHSVEDTKQRVFWVFVLAVLACKFIKYITQLLSQSSDRCFIVKYCVVLYCILFCTEV